MFDHPQVLAQDMIGDFHHPVVGHYRGLQRTIQFSRTPGPEAFSAPTLGQHNEAVLKVALNPLEQKTNP
jgi:formyl-CoA transferase